MSNNDSSDSPTIHKVPFLIDGIQRYSGDTFDVVSPATGKLVHLSSSASVADATSAVEAAAEAFKTWRKTPPAKRRDIFLKAAEVMERRRAELITYMDDETACGNGWAEFNVNTAIDLIKDVAGRIATIAGSFPTLASPDSSAIVMSEPYGVVLAIAPW